MLLENRIAVISGAAQGIGKAIAKKYAENGANVVLCDVKAEQVKNAAIEIEQSTGKKAVGILCDVTKKADVENVIKTTLNMFGKIDILVNNAAILRLARIEDMKEEDWDKIFEVNVKGTFLFTQAMAKVMISQRRGKIINISSCAGKKPVEEHGAYCSTKSAIIGFTRVTALELGKCGITCNAICPGITDTEMVRSTFLTTPEAEREWADKNVLKKIGTMEDQAKAALMLASELSDYITGEAIIVSAGEIMGQ